MVTDNVINDGRESPIASLRSSRTGLQSGNSTNFITHDLQAAATVATPTFRVQISYPTNARGRVVHLRRRNVGTSHTSRGVTNSTMTSSRRVRTFDHIRKATRQWREKLPRIKDVNKIDQYSRVVFPSLFIVFNLCYWCFYILQA